MLTDDILYIFHWIEWKLVNNYKFSKLEYFQSEIDFNLYYFDSQAQTLITFLKNEKKFIANNERS